MWGAAAQAPVDRACRLLSSSCGVGGKTHRPNDSSGQCNGGGRATFVHCASLVPGAIIVTVPNGHPARAVKTMFDEIAKRLPQLMYTADGGGRLGGVHFGGVTWAPKRGVTYGGGSLVAKQRVQLILGLRIANIVFRNRRRSYYGKRGLREKRPLWRECGTYIGRTGSNPL